MNRIIFINFWEIVIFACCSLWRYKLRSFLTMLGIIFGIAAVIAMLAMGAGAREEILREIEKLGITNIIINSVKPPEKQTGTEEQRSVNRYGLTFKDAKQIELTCPYLDDILPVHGTQAAVLYGNKKIDVKVRGLDPLKFYMLNMDIIKGRPLYPIDGESRHRVCLVTPDLLEQIKFIGDPTGMDLRIKDDFFQVVGIIHKPEFTSPGAKSLEIRKNIPDIYMPFESSLARFGTFNILQKAGSWESTEMELDQIVVRVANSENVFSAAKIIKSILEKFHDDVQDYEIVVPLELLRQSEQTQKVFNIVMILIASISLLVGGIGIVNIMLATITERTREIGVRRALGATRKDITFQFLVETVVLAVCGGFFGCILGIAGVYAMDYFTKWTSIITWQSIVISIGISCSVGVIFGIFPARRAAYMDPITALRHE
ncbi:ABC transporter permease [Planctomycetota bacterium]